MKKNNHHIAGNPPRLQLRKTAIANLTLTDRQMAKVMGGMYVTGPSPLPVNSDNTVNADPCTVRPTLLTGTHLA
jgi:hypothetical protein